MNPDGTFYRTEKQEDGSFRYTEYNQSCEETASFTLDDMYSLEKYGDCYYYDQVEDEQWKILRYNLKTKESETFLLEEKRVGMNAIVGDVMMLYGRPNDASEARSIDMSCFDTGKLEIRPVQGLLDYPTSFESD